MTTLKLEYWAKGNKRGFSGWKLVRKDNKKAEFPSYEEIFKLSSKFFPHGEVAVGRYLDNCIILSMPIGSSDKKSREAFVKAIEERMLQ